jgi:hypothetical protein
LFWAAFIFSQPELALGRIKPQHLMKEARMTNTLGMDDQSRDQGRRMLIALAIVALGTLLSSPFALGQNAEKQDKKQTSGGKSVGFILSEDATAKDVGLPMYPGAQRLKDTSDESSALQMGLWGGSSGFKLVVLKLESDDSAEKIAAFYRKALARYGNVVDCSTSSARQKKSDSGHAGQVACENDHPAAGGFAFKAGSKRNQHVVAVEPDGKRTKISLVYVWTPQSESQQD